MKSLIGEILNQYLMITIWYWPNLNTTLVSLFLQMIYRGYSNFTFKKAQPKQIKLQLNTPVGITGDMTTSLLGAAMP